MALGAARSARSVTGPAAVVDPAAVGRAGPRGPRPDSLAWPAGPDPPQRFALSSTGSARGRQRGAGRCSLLLYF